MKKICKGCGAEFEYQEKERGGPRKFCSDECRKAYFREENKKGIEKRCRNCGKLFCGKGSGWFCCEECKTEYKKWSAAKRIIPDKVCIVCGKKIEGNKWKYCSDECCQKDKERERETKKKRYIVNFTQCKTCLYRMIVPDIPYNHWGCGYMYYLGKRRPSEPSPDCTAYKKTNRKERAKLLEKEKQFKFSSGTSNETYIGYVSDIMKRQVRWRNNHKRR